MDFYCTFILGLKAIKHPEGNESKSTLCKYSMSLLRA